MKINYNASAAIANRQLLGIESNLAKATERLSTGYKINHAKDNPAGIAISSKMRAQIAGLDRASNNAADGNSLLNIADGALDEVTSLLQRMRELAVQAASDATMSYEDRQAIQQEVDSLMQEIDRVSTDTEYNTKTLLDGSLDQRVYSYQVTRLSVSDSVPMGDYSLTVTQEAEQATAAASSDFSNDDAIGYSGTISINGSSVEISEDDTMSEVYEKIRDAAEIGNVTATREDDGSISFVSNEYGASAVIQITSDSEDLLNALGLTDDDGSSVTYDEESDTYVFGSTDASGNIICPSGTDPEVELGDGFSASATASFDGRKITISDLSGFSISFAAYETNSDGTTSAVEAGDVAIKVTDIGTLTLHIGANVDQEMDVRIPEISTKSLYLDEVDMTTVDGGSKAISQLDEAIAAVSSARSRIGAYMNRLDYAEGSLDAFSENMSKALSGLADVDMATEMTEFTSQSVLDQAAISVLTQANQIPQMVLSILQ